MSTIATVGNNIGTAAENISPPNPPLIGNGTGGAASGAGIHIQSANNTIMGNRIAGNLGDGIYSNLPSATGNNYVDNRIYDNSGLGINHIGSLGADPNDAGDGDTGPNNRQNYPVITAAKTNGTDAGIAFTLNSTASTEFDVELFSSPSCDGSGFRGRQEFPRGRLRHDQRRRHLEHAGVLTARRRDSRRS